MTAPRPDDAGGALERRLLFAYELATDFYTTQRTGSRADATNALFVSRGDFFNQGWVLGHAPNQGTALVRALREAGFSDEEIWASGLAQQTPTGRLMDRFRGRAMVGIRDHTRRDGPVVAFVGYRVEDDPAGRDTRPILGSPATPIHRPDQVLFGATEMADVVGAAGVIAAHPLQAMEVSQYVDIRNYNAIVVAPSGPRLEAEHVAQLFSITSPRQPVIVTEDLWGGGRHLHRAYELLTAANQQHRPARPLLAGKPGFWVTHQQPLVAAVVDAQLAWAHRAAPSEQAWERAVHAAADLIPNQDKPLAKQLTGDVLRQLAAGPNSAPEPFTVGEYARLRVMTENHIAQEYGDGLFRDGYEAAQAVAARLPDLVEKYGQEAVDEAVFGYSARNYEMLTWKPDDVAANKDRWERVAHEIERNAAEAFKSGDHDRALDAIDAGVRVQPYYENAGRGWQQMRELVEQARSPESDAPTPNAELPAPDLFSYLPDTQPASTDTLAVEQVALARAAFPTPAGQQPQNPAPNGTPPVAARRDTGVSLDPPHSDPRLSR